MTEPLPKCPHCKGELKEAIKYSDWDFDCKRCGRAWIVLDGVYWLAGFDAGGHIYQRKNGGFEAIQSGSDLWQKLWDRVAEK